MNRFFLILFFIAIISIEFLATTTTVHIKIVESMWDKANHFSAFFILYILLNVSKLSFSILWKFLLLFGFGLQIEVVQYFIDGREFSLFDLVADSIGLTIAIVISAIYKKIFP
jgi:VanZ family protein